jgi:hypothetical protein
MIHDPAHAGALAAMNAAMPLPNEQALTPKDAEQPKRKAKPKSDKKEVEKPSGEPRAKGKK